MAEFGRTLLITLVAALSVVSAALALAAWLRWGMRCDEGCYQRATEPGQPWTRYKDSWQWHGQFAVALVAVTATAAAVMTLRVRPLAGLTAATIAVTFAGGWIAWYLATPLHP